MRDDVHHVTVTFYYHLLGHFNAAESRNPAEVIAAKINQHHVLGPLFWIGYQFAREPFVFLDVSTAPVGPGNWTQFGDSIADAQMDFRRAAQDGKAWIEAQTEHVGRRVSKTQRAIKIERLTPEIVFEALRQHHLKNVTRRDQLLGFGDHRFELHLCGVAGRRRKIGSGFRIDGLQGSRFI